MVTYAKIHRLTKPHDDDIDETFRQLADRLRGASKSATLWCTILVAKGHRRWTFDLQGAECRLNSELGNVPDLEIVTGEATWWEIAEGRLSPLDAFKQGRLRVLGDTALGSQLLQHVAEGTGLASICGE